MRAYDEGAGSQRAIAELFGVSRSFVGKLLARRRATGEVAPLPHGDGRLRILRVLCVWAVSPVLLLYSNSTTLACFYLVGGIRRRA